MKYKFVTMSNPQNHKAAPKYYAAPVYANADIGCTVSGFAEGKYHKKNITQ